MNPLQVGSVGPLRCALHDLPERLVGDRVYDSDGLDEALRSAGVEMRLCRTARGGEKRKTDVSYAAATDAGRWNGSSRGPSTGVGS